MEEKKLSQPLSTRQIIGRIVISIIITLIVVALLRNDCRRVLPFILYSYLLHDYERLQKLKSYLILCGTASAFTLLSFWAINHYQDPSVEEWMFLPLSLLLVQRPLRWLFIEILGREPVVKRRAPALDFFYGIVLIVGSIGINTLAYQLFSAMK